MLSFIEMLLVMPKTIEFFPENVTMLALVISF